MAARCLVVHQGSTIRISPQAEGGKTSCCGVLNDCCVPALDDEPVLGIIECLVPLYGAEVAVLDLVPDRIPIGASFHDVIGY